MEFIRTTKGKIVVFSVIAVIIALIVCLIVFLTGGEESYRTINISELSGEVKVDDNGKVYDAYPDMRLADGHALFTGVESYTRMLLDDDKYVKLEEESRAVFEALGQTGSNLTKIRLEKGAITNEITQPLSKDEEYIVNTPNSVLAVRGTFFRVEVFIDENGDYYTDIITYAGSVEYKRILPDGTVVEESVIVNAGFKTRIKMDTSDTIYLVEEIDDNGNVVNTTPIVVSEDVSDEDLVDMYDASCHGHTMFLSSEELEALIIERNINLENYRSKYDGSKIELIGIVTTVPEEQPESVAQTTTESEPAVQTTTEKQENDTTTAAVSSEEEATTAAITSKKVTTTAIEQAPTSELINSETEDVSSEEIKEDITTEDEAEDITSAEEDDEDVTSVEEEVVTVANTTTPYTGRPVIPVITAPVTSPIQSEETTTTPAHECVFEDYVYNDDATCTEDGTQTATCSCGETDTITAEGTATGHTPLTETVNATFTEEGYTLEYCDICGEELSKEIIEVLEPLNLSGGDIVITSTGYSQDGGEEVAYTSDYVFSQADAASNYTLAVQSGSHNIKFDNVSYSISDVNGIIIMPDASVAMSGNLTITADSSDTHTYTLYNGGKIEIVSGEITIKNNNVCAYNSGEIILTDGTLNITSDTGTCVSNEGTFTVNGGTLNTSGQFLVEGTTTINGGTVTASGDTAIYVQGGDFVINDGICTLNGDNGIYSRGNVQINGGTITCEGINADSNDFSINGGDLTTGKFTTYTNINVTGGNTTVTDRMSQSADVIVTGGSLNVNSFVTYSGSVTNGDAEVSCVAVSEIPSESDLTFTKSDGSTYIYKITSDDVSSDGMYYLWLPAISTEFVGVTDENLANYINDNFDTNGDGVLSASEINSMTTIDLSSHPEVASLDGIEFFKSVEWLDISSNTAMTSLDVSKLTSLSFLKCNSSNITSINTGNNTNLTSLYCNNTKLTSIDVSGNTSLYYLYLKGTELTSLDISANTRLMDLNISDTQIASIDLTNQTELRELYCANTPITNLSLAENSRLSIIDVSGCSQLTSLDVSNKGTLSEIRVANSGVASVNLSGATYLSSIDFKGCTVLKSIDISECTRLSKIDVSGTGIAFLNIPSSCTPDTISASNCNHVIPAGTTSYDLSSLGCGFDPALVGNVTGADYDSATGIFSNITGDTITYTYTCGSVNITFTISLTG